MKGIFEVAGGSVRGRMHTEAGRNNQDALYWLQEDDFTVAVVTDGCGSAPHSEVGARLGARLLTHRLVQSMRAGVSMPAAINEACQETLGALIRLCTGLAPDDGSWPKIGEEYFLFSFIGTVLTPQKIYIFWLGDGVYAVDSIVTVLGPYPNNAPPYLWYRTRGAEWEHVIVKESYVTTAVQSLLIGTDGAVDIEHNAQRNLPGKTETFGSLAQFWERDKYFRNPDMARRRLFLANHEHIVPDGAGGIIREVGLLPDDTTFIVIRRRAV